MFTFRKSILFSLAITSLGLQATVSETDKEVKKEVKLEKFTVTSSPYHNRWKDTPASTYRIDEETARLKLQSTSIPDSLRQVPGIYIQRTSPGRSTAIIRGLATSRNLLIADGVRVNNPILREGPNEYWNTLDPYLYSNIEVLMGAGSVLYGSDAAGGVVLLGSKPLTQGETDSGFTHQGGDLYLRYSSGNSSISEHISSEFSFDDKFSFRLGLTRQDFGNVRSGDGQTENFTGYEEWGGFLRAEYFIDEQRSLVLGYDHFDRDDLNRPHKTIYANSFKGTTIGSDGRRNTDFDRRTAFLNYKFRGGEGMVQEADFGVSMQYMSEDFVRYRASGALRQDRDWQDRTYGIYSRLVSETDFGTLSYGFDYYYDDIDSQDNTGASIQGKVADDASYQQLGLYLQNQIALTDRLDFVIGTRYSYVKLNANKVANIGQLSNSWSAWTGNAQLQFALNDDKDAHIYAGVNQAFRAPNISDTTRDGQFATNGNEVPTANLDPEHFSTFETGLRVNKDSWNLQVALYHTLMKDRIARLKNNGNNTKANLDEGYVQGIEIYADVDLTEQVMLFGRVAYQEGYEDTYFQQEITNGPANDELSKMPPLNGEAGLRWTSANEKFWAEASVIFADNQDKLSYGDVRDTSRIPAGGTPGYATYNLRGFWKIRENLELAVALENLSDVAYRQHGSGNNEAGRSISTTLHLKF